MAEEMVQKLLDGQALDTEEFCDFSLEDQNEATAAKGVAPSSPSTFTPELKKNICYVVAAAIVNDKGEVLMIQEAKSYRSGGQTAPDAAFCSPSLARRTKWSIGPDLGSDHLPMLLEIRTGGAPPKMIRKTRWSFKKADWLAFQEECEAAFAEAGPEHESDQELATRFHQALEEASVRHIPRGARNQPRPWALDPELKEAVDARRAARRDLRSGDRSAKERWVEAKRRAASVERRVSQRQFREYVSTTLNKHQSLGRVHKTLKMWEGASDDQHRAAESMEDGDRTLVSDRDKANAFNRTYATVSKQVRDRKVDRDTKTRLKASNVKTCHECWGRKSGYCSPFSEEEPTRQISQAQLKKSPGPDDLCNEHIKHLGPRARELAANTLVKWARRSKMEVAGQKTQLLVLSQNPRDAVDCHIHVAGQLAEGGPELKLLGVTLDRTLSFGPYCRSLRRRVRPRAAQLRRLTGRSWGLQEQQLRAVANGYVRGAIEHAAAAWLPAVSKSNIEILEREMHAVARIVTGCIHSAPHHAGTLCSSFRAEMVALQVTLDHVLEHQRDAPEPVIICTDSLSASCAGQWYLPAGRMEAGETIAEAARREVLEETGLELEPTTLLMVETAGGAWYRFVVTGTVTGESWAKQHRLVTGGRLKTPADADPESLQAQWVADLSAYELRARDIEPLVELARAYHARGAAAWHPERLPAARAHRRLLLRLVVCVRKRANNRVSVLMSEKTSLHLPTCEISPPRSIHSTLKKYMTEMFGADLPPHRPAGVLSVEYSHQPDQPAGLCLTLLVPVRKPLEEVHLIDKYQWCELNRELGHALLDRLGKNQLVSLNVIR
ncbi:8-oxo-dGDP phosphatase NUDT18 [Amphibalanus amphitrite]|uniref:8-oxo-dGDP phosphatase NUDT18 n=1 Tax=Amphibalanus amphitrite TaxID=1232801 RepID=A0A6A4W7S5_AMPAM|nr:8-oxo-dGDP phosphatase NUDT18 [Amphibalanus amphitrite]